MFRDVAPASWDWAVLRRCCAHISGRALYSHTRYTAIRTQKPTQPSAIIHIDRMWSPIRVHFVRLHHHRARAASLVVVSVVAAVSIKCARTKIIIITHVELAFYMLVCMCVWLRLPSSGINTSTRGLPPVGREPSQYINAFQSRIESLMRTISAYYLTSNNIVIITYSR